MKQLRFTFLTAALVIFSLLVENGWGEVQYTLTDLGTGPSGTWSCATGINNSGQVIVQKYNSSYLYSGGSMQDLGKLGANGIVSAANGINNLGHVVGEAVTDPGTGGYPRYAFQYSGSGPMQALDLSNLTNYFSGHAAADINDNGQIVGYFGLLNVGNRAFLYNNGESMLDLGALLPVGTRSSYACAINKNGEVLGYYETDNNPTYGGFVYNGSTMKLLSGRFCSLGAINDSGQVVGQAVMSTDGYTFVNHAFLYNGGGPLHDLGSLGGNSCALGINNNGQVVGYDDLNSTNDTTPRAFLYSNGTMKDLNNLIGPSSGLTLNRATAINDNGQIVGYASTASGQLHAFLLNPIPEPSTLAMLLSIAVGGLLWWKRRKA